MYWVVICRFCLFVFQDRVSLCSPGCPETHSVDRLALHSQISPCLCHAGIKSVHHHYPATLQCHSCIGSGHFDKDNTSAGTFLLDFLEFSEVWAKDFCCLWINQCKVISCSISNRQNQQFLRIARKHFFCSKELSKGASPETDNHKWPANVKTPKLGSGGAHL